MATQKLETDVLYQLLIAGTATPDDQMNAAEWISRLTKNLAERSLAATATIPPWLEASLRDAFPHFQDDAPITMDAIAGIGKEYIDMVMGWEPIPRVIEFVDEVGHPGKLTNDDGLWCFDGIVLTRQTEPSNEIAWLRRLLTWCRQRLIRDEYRWMLDRYLAAGPTEPDDTKIVQSESPLHSNGPSCHPNAFWVPKYPLAVMSEAVCSACGCSALSKEPL